MPKASTVLLFAIFVSSVSLWGCTQQRNDATSARLRELEQRHAKLEQDYRVLNAASEQTRLNITRLEAQRDALARQVEDFEGAAKERDNLRQIVAERTTERDNLSHELAERTNERDGAQSQLLEFSEDLRSLLSRVDVAANAFAPKTTVASANTPE